MSYSADFQELLQRLSSLGISSQDTPRVQHPVLRNDVMRQLKSMSHTDMAHLEDIGANIREELERVQANAAVERKHGPGPPPFLPREPFIFARRIYREKCEVSKQTESIQIKRAFVGTEKHHSSKPLSHLTRSMCNNYVIEERPLTDSHSFSTRHARPKNPLGEPFQVTAPYVL